MMNHLPLTMNIHFSFCFFSVWWTFKMVRYELNNFCHKTEYSSQLFFYTIYTFSPSYLFIYFTGTVSNNGSSCSSVSFYHLKQYDVANISIHFNVKNDDNLIPRLFPHSYFSSQIQRSTTSSPVQLYNFQTRRRGMSIISKHLLTLPLICTHCWYSISTYFEHIKPARF